MDVGRPAHRLEVGELTIVGAIQVHRVHVGDHPVVVEAPPDDALAVGEKKGPPS
jgi:hypothetical protein